MRHFLCVLFCAAFLMPASASAGATPRDSTDAFDVLHYDLHIDFNLLHKSFRGSVGMTAMALRPLHDVALDAASRALTIDSVYSEDVKMDFTHFHNILTVDFQELVPEHAQFEVSVFYHGTSAYNGQYDGGGVYFISESRLATISEPNFARMWWPCKDRPSDKATAHISLTVPESLTAVSNGILMNVTRKEGKATYAWETNYPMATYLFSAAVAPYTKFTDTYTSADGVSMPVDYYVYPEDAEHARIDFQNTLNIVKFFSNKFREYPFIREKFGMAEVDGSTTMEHQTICSIQKNMITGKRTFEMTIVHETAHHWWGDFITPLNWKHTWLSEGFATYAEALYIEGTIGPDSAKRYIHQWMGNEQGMYAGSVVGKSDTAFWDSFAPRVYNKGALVLHMLRGVTGDSLFFMIMKNYLTNPAFAYGNVSTEDFVKECEKVYGKPLQWFFDEWVYSSPDSIDRPEYLYRWDTAKEGDNYRVTLDLEQTTARKQFFRMPLTITLVAAGSRNDYIVDNTLPSQSFSLLSKSKPTDLIIDADEKVVKILNKQRQR